MQALNFSQDLGKLAKHVYMKCFKLCLWIWHLGLSRTHPYSATAVSSPLAVLTKVTKTDRTLNPSVSLKEVM